MALCSIKIKPEANRKLGVSVFGMCRSFTEQSYSWLDAAKGCESHIMFLCGLRCVFRATHQRDKMDTFFLFHV